MATETKTEATKELKREFHPKGEAKQIDLVPVEDGNDLAIAKRIDVEFGEFHTYREEDKSDVKVAGRYRVTWPQVVDGMEQHIVLMGVDAQKTIAQVIKQARDGKVSFGDYVIDLDDEFFEQKIMTPKEDADNVWKSEKFKEVREKLGELSSAAEETLLSLEDAREDAQEKQFELAGVLRQAFEACGESRKALTSWAKGKEGSNSNPMLAKLGRGSNALYEAMKPAYLTQTQRDVLPNTLASGKGIDRHRSLAIAKMAEDVTIRVEWPEDHVTKNGVRFPNVEGFATMLRRVALKAFTVEEVDALELTQLGDAVNEKAAELVAAFNVEFGKSVNTYDKGEYDAALRAYGRLTLSTNAENLFNKAVEEVLAASEEDDDAAMIARLVKLVNNNLFVKKMVEREKQNREVLNDVNDDEVFDTKKGRTRFESLDPLTAAANEFKRISSHDKADEVWAALKAMVAQHGFPKHDEDEEEAA